VPANIPNHLLLSIWDGILVAETAMGKENAVLLQVPKSQVEADICMKRGVCFGSVPHFARLKSDLHGTIKNNAATD
jgi:hypothetical protein